VSLVNKENKEVINIVLKGTELDIDFKWVFKVQLKVATIKIDNMSPDFVYPLVVYSGYQFNGQDFIN